MSGPVTEIAYIPLVPGTDLKTGETHEIWQKTLQTIAAQPGCQSLYWGKQLENPDTVQFAIGTYISFPTILPPTKLNQSMAQFLTPQ